MSFNFHDVNKSSHEFALVKNQKSFEKEYSLIGSSAIRIHSMKPTLYTIFSLHKPPAKL